MTDESRLSVRFTKPYTFEPDPRGVQRMPRGRRQQPLHYCLNCAASTLNRWLCSDCWRIAWIGAAASGVVSGVVGLVLFGLTRG